MTNPSPPPGLPSIATCLRCGTQYNPTAGGDALFCADCAASQPRVSITAVLIALNLLVYIAMTIGGVSPFDPTPQDLLKWGAGYGPYELNTEWWRLFTAMFVHIGILHIALNMLCLYNIGPLAERLFGTWRFLLLYLLSGVGGNVASVGVHPVLVAAGASGAIFGVAGALLPVFHIREIPAIATLRGRGGKLGIGGFIVYNLVYGFAKSGIDNAAHIGGLVVGFVIGYTMPVAGSHAGRAATLRVRGVLLGTTAVLATAFLGVRQLRRGYAEVEQGRRALLADDLGTGIARLQHALQTDPQNIQAHVLLGAAYLDQGKATEAIQEFEQAVRIDSANVFALSNLGQAQYQLQHWTEAAAAFRLAAGRDSTDPDLWSNLGSAYLNARRDSEAVAPLERAAKLQPDTARNHYNLGLAYLRRQKFDAALASFNRALALKPGDPLALLRRGVAYQMLGRVDSARADYHRVLASPPGVANEATLRDARQLLSELPSH